MHEEKQHFFFIFGPPAVGKMTVAYALAEKLKGHVFHNHLSIELLLPLFSFGSPSFSHLNELIRKSVFEEVAKSDISVFVFTFVWALDLASETEYVEDICSIFESKGWLNYFIELESSLEARLKRNRSEFRLSQKASKRDVEASTKRLLNNEASEHHFNSAGDFPFPDKHLKINNTHISAEHVAEYIIEQFGLRDENLNKS